MASRKMGEFSRAVRVLLLVLAAAAPGYFCAEKWENIRTSTPPEDQQVAVQGLLQRLLPNHWHLFEIKIGTAPPTIAGDKDWVALKSYDDDDCHLTEYATRMISIVASNGVAAAWGINHYLKYYLNSHVSWDSIRIEVPEVLPQVNVTLTAMDRFRYMSNVCTYGYTYAFWDVDLWEQHIDWMALNGINLPLAFEGQEAVWFSVYTKLGLDPEELLGEFFSGPAFLPWFRMGNLAKWGGPVTKEALEARGRIQAYILQRMRSFGMTPVLPAFDGHVPKGLFQKFPNSTYTTTKWLSFDPTYLLSFKDPLFARVGESFIKEYAAKYGSSDHVYNCDTFNEMNPQQGDTGYLASAGKAIYGAMAQADPEAVWVMQGWLFVHAEFWTPERAKALLTSVDQGDMLVLDLDSTWNNQYSRLDSYYGQPFIYNDLNNYGGSHGIFGRFPAINDGVPGVRHYYKEGNGTMVGIGATPEGLSDTYVTTEFLFEMGWRRERVPNVEDWVGAYVSRRYGLHRNDIKDSRSRAFEAWTKVLKSGALNATGAHFNRRVLIAKLPSLGLSDYVWFNTKDMAEAWDLMLVAANETERLKSEAGFRFDLVNVARQVMTNVAAGFYATAMKAFQAKNQTEFGVASRAFCEILRDLDVVLATDENFLLGKWLERSKAFPDPKSALTREMNARNQITLWGPDGEIMDYAAKQWSGLINDYYLARWRLFFSRLDESLKSGNPFDQNAYTEEFLDQIGRPFSSSRKLYPARPIGDPYQVVEKAHRKWRRWGSFQSVP